MIYLKRFVFLFFVFCLSACAFNVVEPKTPRESLAYVYTGIDVAAKTVFKAHELGQITVDKKNEIAYRLNSILLDADKARALIEDYEAVGLRDMPPDADVLLSRASAALNLLESILVEVSKDE